MTTSCAEPGCPDEIPDHRWGRIHAHDDGWFQQKDGTVWCPEHIPDWVQEWRARRDAEAAAVEPPPRAAVCPRCFTVPAVNGECACA